MERPGTNKTIVAIHSAQTGIGSPVLDRYATIIPVRKSLELNQVCFVRCKYTLLYEIQI